MDQDSNKISAALKESLVALRSDFVGLKEELQKIVLEEAKNELNTRENGNQK